MSAWILLLCNMVMAVSMFSHMIDSVQNNKPSGQGAGGALFFVLGAANSVYIAGTLFQ